MLVGFHELMTLSSLMKMKKDSLETRSSLDEFMQHSIA
jgi:hypothetical protein